MLPSVASAQQVGGYIEGNIGAAFVSSVDISVDSGETGSLDFGNDVFFGAEAGIRGLRERRKFAVRRILGTLQCGDRRNIG